MIVNDRSSTHSENNSAPFNFLLCDSALKNLNKILYKYDFAPKCQRCKNSEVILTVMFRSTHSSFHPPPHPPPISVPDPGPDRHAGGAGDLLRAAAAQAAEEDVLREEGEAAGPPGHPGARPPVLRHRVQEVPERRQGPPFRQLHHSGHPQRRPHGRLGRPRRAVGGGEM